MNKDRPQFDIPPGLTPEIANIDKEREIIASLIGAISMLCDQHDGPGDEDMKEFRRECRGYLKAWMARTLPPMKLPDFK